MLLACPVVAVVGWSRVALRDHSPAQVLAGAALGAAAAATTDCSPADLTCGRLRTVASPTARRVPCGPVGKPRCRRGLCVRVARQRYSGSRGGVWPGRLLPVGLCGADAQTHARAAVRCRQAGAGVDRLGGREWGGETAGWRPHLEAVCLKSYPKDLAGALRDPKP
ncbi:phosphatase PAP2 family protein [Streptomyces erythrochromogenes]|uniref:phosphatase PAP2 family protein n=1 Tax=Streptomyces erythrochromogenes TaxID=285574 RepID=UPI0034411D7F